MAAAPDAIALLAITLSAITAMLPSSEVITGHAFPRTQGWPISSRRNQRPPVDYQPRHSEHGGCGSSRGELPGGWCSEGTQRSGQQAALGSDLLALGGALRLEAPILAGAAG
jgi:hypothetical protein